MEIGVYDGGHDTSANEHDEAEEPQVGSLSAEARAAALAETGVLEGAIEEIEEIDEDDGDAGDEAAGQRRVDG